MPPPNRLVELIIKHLEETLTVGEEQELEAAIAASPDNQALFLELTEGEELDRLIRIAALDIDESWKKVEEQVAANRRTKYRLLWGSLSAAAALLLIGLVVWWDVPSKRSSANLSAHSQATAPTGPGSQYLLLDNGRWLSVDSLPEGPTQLAGTLLIKQDSLIRLRQVLSEASGSGMIRWYASRKRYILTLPDSSEAMPEDSTSLQFASSLGQGERTVFITGAGYFHVNDRLRSAFTTVMSTNALLSDPVPNARAIATGTSYYVSARPGKGQQTVALYEGKLIVTKGIYTETLLPDQTIILSDTGKPLIQHTALPAAPLRDPGDIFSFNNAPIQDIIATIQKKYKCAVRYKKVPTKRITLTISQQAPLSKVVDVLRLAGCAITMQNDSLLIGQ